MSDYYKHVLTYDAGSNTWKPKTLSFTSVAYGVKPEGWDIHGYRSDGYYNHGTRAESPTGAGFHQAVDDLVFYHYVYNGSIDSVSPYPENGYNSFGYTIYGVITPVTAGFPNIAALDDGFYYSYDEFGYSTGKYTGGTTDGTTYYTVASGVRSLANLITNEYQSAWYSYVEGLGTILDNNEIHLIDGKYRLFITGGDVGHPNKVWDFGGLPYDALGHNFGNFDGLGGGEVINQTGYYLSERDSLWRKVIFDGYNAYYDLAELATGVDNAHGTNLWYVFDGAGGATLASGMLLCNDGKYRIFNSNGTFKEYPSGQITLDNGDIVIGDGAGGVSFPYNHQYHDVTSAYWWDNSTLATGNSVYTSQHGNTKANSITFYLGEDGVAGFTKVITDSIGVATVTVIDHGYTGTDTSTITGYFDTQPITVGTKIYTGRYTLNLVGSGTVGFGVNGSYGNGTATVVDGVVTLVDLVTHNYYWDAYGWDDDLQVGVKVYEGRYSSTASASKTIVISQDSGLTGYTVVTNASGFVTSKTIVSHPYTLYTGAYSDYIDPYLSIGHTLWTGANSINKAVNLSFIWTSGNGIYDRVTTNSQGVASSTEINHQYSISSTNSSLYFDTSPLTSGQTLYLSQYGDGTNTANNYAVGSFYTGVQGDASYSRVTTNGSGVATITPVNHAYSSTYNSVTYWYDTATLVENSVVYTGRFTDQKSVSSIFYIGTNGVAGYKRVVTNSSGVVTSATLVDWPYNDGAGHYYLNSTLSTGDTVYTGRYSSSVTSNGSFFTVDFIGGNVLVTTNSSGVATVTAVNHPYSFLGSYFSRGIDYSFLYGYYYYDNAVISVGDQIYFSSSNRPDTVTPSGAAIFSYGPNGETNGTSGWMKVVTGSNGKVTSISEWNHPYYSVHNDYVGWDGSLIPVVGTVMFVLPSFQSVSDIQHTSITWFANYSNIKPNGQNNIYSVVTNSFGKVTSITQVG